MLFSILFHSIKKNTIWIAVNWYQNYYCVAMCSVKDIEIKGLWFLEIHSPSSGWYLSGENSSLVSAQSEDE